LGCRRAFIFFQGDYRSEVTTYPPFKQMRSVRGTRTRYRSSSPTATPFVGSTCAAAVHIGIHCPDDTRVNVGGKHRPIRGLLRTFQSERTLSDQYCSMRVRRSEHRQQYVGWPTKLCTPLRAGKPHRGFADPRSLRGRGGRVHGKGKAVGANQTLEGDHPAFSCGPSRPVGVGGGYHPCRPALLYLLWVTLNS